MKINCVWIDHAISFPLLLSIFFMCYSVGCTPAKNYAPVRSYSRSSLEKEKYYEVKQGDTLYSIGFRSGYGYRRLAIWNKISQPYQLEIGRKIKLFKSKQLLRNKSDAIHQTQDLKVKKKSIKKTVTISNIKKKVLKLHWQWPIKGKVLKNFSKSGEKGIDIAGKKGQKVKSSSAGKVVYSGSGLSGYGNLLIIKHNHLYLSAYANNSRLLVKEGQTVKKGQNIAEVGRVGGKQASLHFEIRRDGKPVNPLGYLPRK